MKYTIADMNKLARMRGGPKAKCLSPEYLGARTDLMWLCPTHGEFKMRPGNVRTTSWCQLCAYEKRAREYPKRLSLKSARDTAKERGGKCLSDVYVNSATKMEWKCRYGHQWTASLTTIRRGHWCGECSGGQGEQVCRLILEDLFGVRFPRARPTWMRNPRTGFPLELDGYSQEMKIAFEYQGYQHHEPKSHFTKTGADFLEQKQKDLFKKKACLKNQVVLLQIPQVLQFQDLSKFKIHIQEELKKNRVSFDRKKILSMNLSKLKIYNVGNDLFIERLRELVANKGGKVFNIKTARPDKLTKFKCAKGHKAFSTIPNNVLGGTWCPSCGLEKIGDLKRLKIESVSSQAAERGFKFLSKTYQNARVNYEFECLKCGHVRSCAFNNIQSGFGCPKCARNLRHNIEVCQEAAKLKGGKCLSKNYLGARVPLWWQCKLEHPKWTATPSRIINNQTWCPTCWSQRRGKRKSSKSKIAKT